MVQRLVELKNLDFWFFDVNLTLPKALSFYDALEVSNLLFYGSFLSLEERKNFCDVLISLKAHINVKNLATSIVNIKAITLV